MVQQHTLIDGVMDFLHMLEWMRSLPFLPLLHLLLESLTDTEPSKGRQSKRKEEDWALHQLKSLPPSSRRASAVTLEYMQPVLLSGCIFLPDISTQKMASQAAQVTELSFGNIKIQLAKNTSYKSIQWKDSLMILGVK